MKMKNQQTGFSLTELMIAITLGLVLMGAALQFLLSTRQTFRVNDDLSRIQENGRAALDIMIKDVRHAGYVAADVEIKPAPLYNGACGALNPCTDDEVDAVRDRFAVQYQRDNDSGTLTDCAGTGGIAEGRVVANVYTIANDANGISSLYCQGYDVDNSAWLEAAAVPLISGIDAMQVLYGVADAPGGNVLKYVAASNLAGDDWSLIRSVRIALLVNNGMESGFAEPRARSYTLLDHDTTTTAATDRRLRSIYSTTVFFNNTYE